MKPDEQINPIPTTVLSRRAFLRNTGLSAGALAAAASPLAEAQTPMPPGMNMPMPAAKSFQFGQEPLRLRKSFHEFTEDEVKNFCAAVGYLRNGTKNHPLAVNAPLQWDQLVSTHAYHCTEVTPESGQQVHWSWFFLPWHRAYLFFLERIIADVLTKVFNVDGTKFALPYWDWIDHQEVPNTADRAKRKVPSPFFGFDLTQEDMVDADNLALNSEPFDNQGLWDGYRTPSIEKPEMSAANEKSEASKQHIIETKRYMGRQFVLDMLMVEFEDFGGKPTTSQADDQGLLEHYPHNNGHDWVGSRYGKNRDMGTLRWAGLDPLFYLHHANIDRIWSHYRRALPDSSSTSPWGKQTYTFLDLDGSLVSVTVSDVISHITNVQYVEPEGSPFANQKKLMGAAAVTPAAPTQSEVLVGKTATLTTAPLTLKPEAGPTGHKLLNAAGTSTKPPLSILEITTGPILFPDKFTVRVFVNKPDADAKTPASDPHYVGRLRGLDSEGRRSESNATISHTFPILIDAESPFYKLVKPGEAFTITLVPVGHLSLEKSLAIPIKEVRLKVVAP